MRRQLQGYDMRLMNVRSYRYEQARQAARLFKELNPRGRVITGGMHTTVCPDAMEATDEFDKICIGPGEETIVYTALLDGEFDDEINSGLEPEFAGQGSTVRQLMERRRL